jgi:hypothetical protein
MSRPSSDGGSAAARIAVFAGGAGDRSVEIRSIGLRVQGLGFRVEEKQGEMRFAMF